jgi:3-hydroxyisobutyrate dehydrogenase
MTDISFIGLGNMGFPMARHLTQAGNTVRAYDIVPDSVSAAGQFGAQACDSLAEATEGAEHVITMVPAGPHVREIYLSDGGILDQVAEGALLIDSSTIDLESAEAVQAVAAERGIEMIDAPVTGAIFLAEEGNLNFLVGGTSAAFNRAKPLLEPMARNVFHTGPAGSGLKMKICNNMILGSTMVLLAEAFTLGKKLGLDQKTMFDILSQGSSGSWMMDNYCPVPGIVPGNPASNDYKPGFTGTLMRKDLRLAQQAAHSVQASTPIGGTAAALMAMHCMTNDAELDFSSIIKMIDGEND